MKFDWKQKKTQLVVVLLVGILLVVIAFPTKERTDNRSGEQGVEGERYREDVYREGLERRLEQTLREVEGAGSVKVMITLQSSAEKIVEKDREQSGQTVAEADKQGGTRETDDKTQNEMTVYDSASGGAQTPYVTKEMNPKVEGVVVIAQGGGNAIVVKNITEAVQALFGVETHKIKVMKRNQTN